MICLCSDCGTIIQEKHFCLVCSGVVCSHCWIEEKLCCSSCVIKFDSEDYEDRYSEDLKREFYYGGKIA